MAAGATTGGSSYKERYLLSVIGDEVLLFGLLFSKAFVILRIPLRVFCWLE